MDELDESFELLSTMSPKLHKSKKNVLNRKVVTKLSLKKNIRRSSIYDNLQPTVKTRDVELSDYISTDSSTNSLVKKNSEVIIVINESIENECPLPVEEGLLSKSRYNYIENWIELGIREKPSNSDDDDLLIINVEESIDTLRKKPIDKITESNEDDLLGENIKCNENDLVSKYLGKNEFKTSQIDKASKILNDGNIKSSENDLLSKYLGENNSAESKFKDLPFKVPVGVRTNNKVGKKSNDNELSKYLDNKLKDSSKNSVDDRINKKVGRNSNDKIRISKENDLLSKYLGNVNIEESTNKSKDLNADNPKNEASLDTKNITKYHNFCEPLGNLLSSTIYVNNDDLVPDSSVKATPSNLRTKSQFVKTTEGHLVSKFINRRKNSKDNAEIDTREVQINIENPKKMTDKENKKNSINLEFRTPAKPVEDELEVTSCLDELYGKEWRLNKESVMSEKKVKPRKEESVKVARTEVKPKKTESLYRRKQDVGKSPWLMKLKMLCDEESEDSNEDQNGIKIKQKLQFDDCEDSDGSDFSCVGLSLKDKIKGMNEGKSNRKPPPLKKQPVLKIQEISKILISDSDDDSSDDLNFESKLMDKLNVVKTIMKTNSKVDAKRSKNIEDEEEVMGNLNKLLHRISLQAKPITKSSTKPITFLQSLSQSVPLEKCELSVRLYRKNFKNHRDELTQKLFKLFNNYIFDRSMSEDMPLEWSEKLTRTAGYCSCRKITRRTGAIERKVKIVLSSKVLDSPDRLRDTLVHEMCHAATWIVDKVSNGHGAYWQAWAIKAMKVFPELPPIKRCHDYAINTKFTYKCTQCGYSFGRHSKSLDITRKCCGICRGKFEVLLNKKSKNGETKAVPVDTKKPPTGFALFVKENYGNYKSESLKHAEVMQILGKKFSEMKVAKA